MKKETYKERRDRESREPTDNYGPGHETYEEKQERWTRSEEDYLSDKGSSDPNVSIYDNDYWSIY